MWVKRELAYAMIQKRFEDGIIPVIHRLSGYEKLHWSLASFQMVDVSGGFEPNFRS